MKHTLFISHANPEDNYFATWLASKLRLLGYDVWCEIQELQGGEAFWREVELTIQNKSAKFLFVVTSASLSKSGTGRELAFARTIDDRKNFIVPLRLEAVPYSTLPIELSGVQHIGFVENWGAGLQKLLSLLEREDIHQTDASTTGAVLEQWWEMMRHPKTLVERPERYRSNWFALNLPRHIHVYDGAGLQLIPRSDRSFVQLGDQLVSFACAKCLFDEPIGESAHDMLVVDHLGQTTIASALHAATPSEANNVLIELLNRAFRQYAANQGLFPYEQAGQEVLYFHGGLGRDRTTPSLRHVEKHRVSLFGKMKKWTWHYAVNAQAFLRPWPAFAVSHHIVFREGGIVVPPKLQHKLRRRLGSGWYNKKWRDLLLGAMFSLADDGGLTLRIPVCCNQFLDVSVLPEEFESPIGYLEGEE